MGNDWGRRTGRTTRPVARDLCDPLFIGPQIARHLTPHVAALLPLSLYFISPVSISVGRRRSPPPPAVLIAGGHPRRPSPSPFAVLARRPRRKLEPRRGLLQPVPRRAAIMDGEHGERRAARTAALALQTWRRHCRTCRTPSCYNRLTKMLQTKMKKASTRYIKSCKQSLPWRSATTVDIKCYNP